MVNPLGFTQLVALVGSAPPGSALQDEGVWGALDVVLNTTAPASGGGNEPAEAAAYSGPLGQAQALRWGVAVRDPADAPAQTPTPGAALLGTWNPTPAERDAGAYESERPTLPAEAASAATPTPMPTPTTIADTQCRVTRAFARAGITACSAIG